MDAQPKNPFDILNDVGCRNEQLDAALHLLSDELHEEMELQQDKDETALRDRLYRLWLTLELVRSQAQATGERFHEAEQALYAAGIPLQMGYGAVS